MSHVVDLPLAEGGSIKVEVDEAPTPLHATGPVTRSGRPAELASTATDTFEQALAGVGPAARSLISKLRATTDPSEITLEFNLKVSADAGVIVARTGGEANFSVQLKWTAG
jgi:hypothetical protein